MKLRFKQNAPPFEKTASTAHVQDLTDDLANVINGGLSMKDGNLPFKLYSGEFTSGRAKEVTASSACVVYCDSTVTSISWKTIKKDLLSVTLTMDATKAQATLLLITETP